MSRGRAKQYLYLVESEKDVKVCSEQKLPKVLTCYSGGRLPGRSTKEKGREEVELDEGSEEREIRSETAQEVVAGIKEKASAHDAKATAQRAAGQSVEQNWDCSQIENEEEEEEDDWRKENLMEVQREEDEKLEEILERRRMEGSSMQLEVMQKVPE